LHQSHARPIGDVDHCPQRAVHHLQLAAELIVLVGEGGADRSRVSDPQELARPISDLVEGLDGLPRAHGDLGLTEASLDAAQGPRQKLALG